MMTKIKLLMLIIFYLIISASAHAAGGIALGATRIIYPADAKQTAVWIRNSHTNERFLVNSWIENSSGVKEKSFIITPPLFVSEPKSENTGSDSNLLIVFYVQIMPDDLVMQLHRF